MKSAAVFVAVAIFVASLCHARADGVTPKLKAEECAELGFDAATLACSSCALLPSYVADEALVAECRQCCSEEETTDDRVFDNAHLEMDKGMMPGLAYYYPGLHHFLNKDPYTRFPGLELVHKRATRPRLVFIDAEGAPQLTTALDGWKEETIREYLEAKLTGGTGKPRAGDSATASPHS